MMGETEKKSYECNLCKRKCQGPSQLENHIRSHTKEKPFRHRTCGKSFAQNSTLKKHIRLHSSSPLFLRPFTCDKCGIFFPRKHNLIHHIFNIHASTEDKEELKNAFFHKCKFCPKRFSANYLLEQHIRSHTGEKPFQCKICRKEFATNGNLKIHMRIHDANPLIRRPYECHHCGKRFTACGLKYHTKTTHSNQQEKRKFLAAVWKHECKFCSKKLAGKSHLEIHLRSHTGEKPFRCETCGKELTSKQSLKDHVRRHDPNTSVQRPFKCEKCGKRFICNGHLKRHTMQHDPEKRKQLQDAWNFKCKFCKKGFESTSKLEIHIRTHTGEKPFKCGTCGVAFTQNGTLKTHMRNIHDPDRSIKQKRSHTKKKRLQCKICREWFTGTSYLKKHNLLHQSNPVVRLYPIQCGRRASFTAELFRQFRQAAAVSNPSKLVCYFCDKRFSKFSELQGHMAVHTKEQQSKFRRDTNEKSHSQNVVCRSAENHPPMPPNPFVRLLRINCGKKVSFKTELFENFGAAAAVSLRDVCYFCDKKFFNISLLYSHMKVHTRERSIERFRHSHEILK